VAVAAVRVLLDCGDTHSSFLSLFTVNADILLTQLEINMRPDLIP